MSRFEDRYYYPGTEALINHFGIRDADKLKAAEERLTAGVFLHKPENSLLSIDGFRNAHKSIFGGLYPWAGEFRSENAIKRGDLERGEADVRFMDGGRVTPEMGRLFSELSHDRKSGAFSGLDPQTFGYRAAFYLADLNHIHPFPDGNGRMQRLFLADLGAEAGHPINQRAFTRENWIGASIMSREKGIYDQRSVLRELPTGPGSMPALIASAIDRPSRETFREKWDEHQDRTVETSRTDSSVHEPDNNRER